VDDQQQPVSTTPVSGGIQVDLSLSTPTVICTFNNTPVQPSQFLVSKDFSDDNGTSVDIALSCSPGSVTNSPQSTSDGGNPATFNITGSTGATSCTATEVGGLPVGYTKDESNCSGVALSTGSCTITNTLNTATFTVNKTYSDSNQTAVTINLSCSSGDVTSNGLSASPGNAAEFEVTGFTGSPNCTATETDVPAGYTTSNAACQNVGLLDPGTCTITNTLNTGQFTVIKEFSDDNNTPVSIIATCSSGSVTNNPQDATDGGPNAVFNVEQFEPGVTCKATEGTPPAGYIKDESDCQNGDAIDTSCTIINTLAETSFTVVKDFTDNNPATVSISLDCSGDASVINSPQDASEGSNAVFAVTNSDQNTTCTATEIGGLPSGYTKNEAGCLNVSLANPGACTIVNTPNAGTFTVRKTFSDGNPSSVEVTASCSSGEVTNNPQFASSGSPAVFNVEAFTNDPPTTCRAVETGSPVGYTADNSDCQDDDPINGECEIKNSLDPVDFRVFKRYTDSNTTPVQVSLQCTNGGQPDASPKSAAPGNPAVFSVSGFTSIGGTCTATEVVPNGYTGDESDCLAVRVTPAGNPGCEIVNTPNSSGLKLQKAWVDGVQGDTALLKLDGENDDSDTSTATGGTETDTANTADIIATVGETVTLSETLGGGNGGDYLTSFGCSGSTNQPDYTPGATTATLLIDRADANKQIVCTFTNTLNTANLKLRKAWVDAVQGDFVDLGIQGNNSDTDTSTAAGGDQTDDVETADVVVLVGETVTLSETPGAGNTGNYSSSLACTGSVNQPNYAAGSKTATLLLAPGDRGKSITCTYTNRLNKASLKLQKAWDGSLAGDTALLNLDGAADDTDISTATGTSGTDTGNTADIVALAGETVVLSETLGDGNAADYAASLFCTGAANAPAYAPGATTAKLLIDPSDRDITCTYTNTLVVQPTTFLVTKDFDDDNEAAVEVKISCNTGVPLEQTKKITEQQHVEFVVRDFKSGELDCDISEVVPEGYLATYSASSLGGNAGSIGQDSSGCHYGKVVNGRFSCHIVNALQKARVDVTKIWFDVKEEFNNPTFASAEWVCTPVARGSDRGTLWFQGTESTDSFHIYPYWKGGSVCKVTERVSEGGVLSDDSDCASIVVPPGGRGECTIENTRLYEGIPTLSQYGLALLALLMLGVGVIAFRRVV
jgi:hypothetical protein